MQSSESGGGNGPQKKAEVRLKAQAVSRGVAVGKVLCLYGRNRQFYRAELREAQVAGEIRRLRAAFRLSIRQLKNLSRSSNGQSKATPGIFDAHRMILEDISFREKIESMIGEERVNAEWAVKSVGEGYISRYKSIADESLRERYIDLEDVIDRVQNALGGGSSHLKIEKNTVLAAQELKPSTIAELSDRFPVALITEHGGWTSHTFILAREINIPAVTGVRKVLRRLKTGDAVVVDGFTGQLIVNPKPSTIESSLKDRIDAVDDPLVTTADDPSTIPKTLDGREITVRANLDIPSIYGKARKLGALGIGLYRSEFLFNQFKGFPSENEQAAAYGKVAEFAGSDGVKIRTFDLNAEQLYGEAVAREKNPALGLRAIRLSLSHRNEFRTQLRAILRAAYKRTIDIVVPMITGVAEVRIVRQMLEKEREYLTKKGIEIGEIRLGAMVEVPSSLFLIDEIVEESDLICLGTNDLVQYLLAADRDNESVADWFRTVDPAVIRAIARVSDSANTAGKPLIVCGEMAGSPFYIPLLIGLGITEMSMNMNSISRVRRTIAGVAYEECVILAKQALACRTADEIEDKVFDHIEAKWARLFPQSFIKNRKL